MLQRRILTSHSQLAQVARERVLSARLSALAGAVRDHERRTARLPISRRPYDDTLYRRLRQIGIEAR